MTSALEKQRSLTVYVWLYLAVYGVCSALFLTGFPFVHSDESWLAGLSRDMMAEGSLGVTESFFNAKVRYPHAIKSIYHLLQQAYIALFGYSPFAVRLLSLTGAIVFLWLFYLLAKRFTEKEGLSFALMILLSLHTWFIYISHFARQESWLLALMAGVMYALTKRTPGQKYPGGSTRMSSDHGALPEETRRQTQAVPRASLRPAMTAALLTGIAIGFHPNSFLLACVAGGILLAQLLQAKKRFDFRNSPFAPLVLYVCVVALFAAFFIAVSYSFGPHFLRNYFAYGAADFGLDAPPGDRLTELFGFFTRLWKRESGTYYLPETRVFFVLMLLLVIGMTVYAVRKKDRDVALLPAGLSGLIAGIYIIGRFNQMSFIFFFPFVYLLAGKALLLLPRRQEGEPFHMVFLACAFSIQLLTSALQIRPWLLPPAVSSDRKAASDGTYDGYLRELEALVPRDAKTIANLNTAFYFDQGKLLDYRNLPYVMQGESDVVPGPDADAPDPAGVTTASPVSRIAAYVEENHVEYILYTAELDYLLSHRPYYNVIYGNIMFAEALKEYCETRCEAVGSFTDTRYGARVIALMGDERYGTVTVYRVVG